MIRSLRTRKAKAFTLVELLIVILLIAILMAFALPKFLGNRDKAADRVAQQTLKSALGTVNGVYADTEDYKGATAAKLAAKEQDISFKADKTSATTNGSAREVGVTVSATGDSVVLTARGAKNVCWYIKAEVDKSTLYGYEANTDGTCETSKAPTTNVSATANNGWNTARSFQARD